MLIYNKKEEEEAEEEEAEEEEEEEEEKISGYPSVFVLLRFWLSL